jgi:hypothetical protein
MGGALCKDSGAGATQLPDKRDEIKTCVLYGDSFDSDSRMIRSVIKMSGGLIDFKEIDTFKNH